MAKSAKVNIGQPSKTASGGIEEIEKHGREARMKYSHSLKQSDAEKAAEKRGRERLEGDKANLEGRWKSRKEDLDEVVKEAKKAVKDAKTPEEKKTLQEEVDRVEKERIDAERRHIAALNKINQEIDENRIANSPEGKYARSLSAARLQPWPSIGNEVDHTTAEEILKELRKSKTEKAIESLKKSVEKAGRESKEKLEEVTEAVKEEEKGEEGGSGGGGADHSH